jgi:hypothetical protein
VICRANKVIISLRSSSSVQQPQESGGIKIDELKNDMSLFF